MKNRSILIVLICSLLSSCTHIDIPVWPVVHHYVRVAPSLYTIDDGHGVNTMMLYQKIKSEKDYPQYWSLTYGFYDCLEPGKEYEEGYEYILKETIKRRVLPAEDNPDNPYHEEVTSIEIVSKNEANYLVPIENILR